MESKDEPDSNLCGSSQPKPKRKKRGPMFYKRYLQESGSFEIPRSTARRHSKATSSGPREDDTNDDSCFGSAEYDENNAAQEQPRLDPLPASSLSQDQRFDRSQIACSSRIPSDFERHQTPSVQREDDRNDDSCFGIAEYDENNAAQDQPHLDPLPASSLSQDQRFDHSQIACSSRIPSDFERHQTPSVHQSQTMNTATESDDDCSSSSFDDSDNSEMEGCPQRTEEHDEVKLPNFTRLKQKYGIDEPLTPNVNTTKFECYLMILSLAMQEGLSNMGISRVMKLINALFGRDVIPDSMFIFTSLFKCDIGFTYHFYCSDCESYIGDYNSTQGSPTMECPLTSCGKKSTVSSMNNGHFFISIPLKPQLKVFLETMPDAEKSLSYRFHRGQPSNVISDVFDGLLYRKLCDSNILSNVDNFSVTLNTDGAPIFKSVNKSLWPIQCRINELPPDQRFASDNMFVCGLWFGSNKPNMNVFLSKYVEESYALFHKGFSWSTRKEELKLSKVVMLNCCLDSRAKPEVQCFKQLHAYNGCSYCYHPGNLVDLKKNRIAGQERPQEPEAGADSDISDLISEGENEGNDKAHKEQKKKSVQAVRYCVSNGGFYPDRTDEEMRYDMTMSQQQNRTCRGVKGMSALMAIPFFNVVYGFVIDYMHAILLGVVKTLLSFWFDPKFSKQPYSIRARLSHVDARLLAYKPPKNISRRPRSLKEYHFFKANELRSWLYFYSLPSLDGILPDVYFKHFSLLVSAVFILCSDTVSRCDLERADEYLKLFVTDFETLYGPAFMVHNIHLLLHIGQMVLLWGPLWSFSAFGFETGNGVLKNLVKGTVGVVSQITRKYIIYRIMPLLVQEFEFNRHVVEFCENLIPKRSCRHVTKCEGITLLGSIAVAPLSTSECRALQDARLPQSPSCYHRFILNGTLYHSATFPKQGNRSNDSVVKTSDGNYGVIMRVILVSDEIYLILKNINIEANVSIVKHDIGAKAAHIKVCCLYPFGAHKVVNANDVVSKCVFLQYQDTCHVCEFPNTFEKD